MGRADFEQNDIGTDSGNGMYSGGGGDEINGGVTSGGGECSCNADFVVAYG